MATIVLVGGGLLGAWAWERVTPALRVAGHEVVPLTLTGFGDRAHLASPATTLSVHATDIAAALTVAGLSDVVLVLHSYAGAPGTIAAARVPDRIGRIVYLAGLLPVPGKTIFEAAPPGLEEVLQGYVDRDGAGWLIPVYDDEVLDTYYGDHGLSTEDRAWLRARAVPQPVATYRDPAPADLSAAERLPRTYVACAGDPGDPPVLPGAATATIDAGHWPMVTAPAELAALLDRLAR